MLSSKVQKPAAYIGAIPQFLASTGPVALADTHPVIDELADVAKDVLSNLVRGALAGAGRHFTARAERAEEEQRRRELLDALHTLRLSVGPVQRAFAVELDRSFARPSATESTAPSPAPISPLCQTLWHGVHEQLQVLGTKLSVAGADRRFAPERFQAVLRSTIARTEMQGRTGELTLELLELGVLSHLDQVYRRVIERLDQYSLPGAAPEFPVAANQPSAAGAATPALHIDPLTKALLVEVAQSRESGLKRGTVYSNAQLATELLESLKSGNFGSMPVRTRAIIQRLALVGRMFGAISADPLFPAKFKQGFETLRFPIIKSALADPSFFTHRAHSLRVIANDLLRRAIDVFLCGPDRSAPLQNLLRRWADDFDLSAEYVRPALAGVRPLPPAVIEKFLAELHDDGRERALWALDRARDIARTATEARFIGKILPPSILPRIGQEWSQVLAHRLVEQGHDGWAWHDGLRSLEQLMEHALGADPAAPLDGELRERLATGLKEAGLSEDLLDVAARLPHLPLIEEEASLVDAETEASAIEPAHATTQAEKPDATATAIVAEPEPSPLENLLKSARWYRVYDHRQKKTRWLRLEAFYPKQDSVAFVEIDGASPLCMKAGEFLDDLRTGRSAPTNPDAYVRRLIQQLQRESAA